MTELDEAEFRKLLEQKGIHLDGKAFLAALKGARHIKAEVARLNDSLKAGLDTEQ